MKTDYKIINEDNNLIYLDINILNDSRSRTPATFIINRSSPLLPENNDQYVASIVRFTIPLTVQPLYVFFNNESNIDTAISIKYNNNIYTKTLIFQRTDYNSDVNYSNIEVSGGIYQYQTICNMINNAIKAACVDAGILDVPYMVFDIPTSKYIVYQPISWADIYPYTDITKPKLFFNKILSTYFINFNNITYDNTINNNLCDYLIICSNNRNNLYKDENDISWYSNAQEWNSPQYTNRLSNITIVSNLFPSVGDSLNNTRFQDSNFSSNTLKVISDFEIDKSEVGGQRGVVQYQSQNNRYIDMTGNNKLYNLDFSFYVFFNELINVPGINPYQKIILNPFEVISLKILFKKKSMNF